MGLTIYKDAIYEKTIDGTTPEGYSWEPWPVIRGESGEDVYHTWLKEQGLTDTTEWEHWDEFLATLQTAYGGIAGASRVAKIEEPAGSGTYVYRIFTPTQTGTDPQEPPAQGATFSGYTAEDIPVTGVTQHEIGLNGQVRPIHTGTYPVTDDATLTNINAEDLAAIKNAQVVMGNRGNGSGVGIFAGYAIDHLVSTAVSTSSMANQLVSGANGVPDTVFNKTYQEVYSNSRTVNVIGQGETGNLYIGGSCGDSESAASFGKYTNLGATILVAGAGSWSGVEANQHTGVIKGYNSQLPAGSAPSLYTKNGILVTRKVGENKKWSGNWNVFMLPDSGHFEIINFTLSKNLGSGHTYKYQVNSANTYLGRNSADKPTVLYNWQRWQPTNTSNYVGPSEYYDIWTEYVHSGTTGRGILFIYVYVKKVAMNILLNDAQLSFLLISNVSEEVGWVNKNPVTLQTRFQVSN